MVTGRCNTVTALLEVQPELKITEFSTQYDRDALLDITERPKLSEGTETVEDALFGTEDRRPSHLPQPPRLEPGPLGSAKPTKI